MRVPEGRENAGSRRHCLAATVDGFVERLDRLKRKKKANRVFVSRVESMSSTARDARERGGSCKAGNQSNLIEFVACHIKMSDASICLRV